MTFNLRKVRKAVAALLTTTVTVVAVALGVDPVAATAVTVGVVTYLVHRIPNDLTV
jgi:hypothetical protein